MTIFDITTIEARKRRTSLSLNEVLRPGDAVLVCSGEPMTKPGGHDQTYPFLPHPDYFWLTGSRRAHGISAYSKATGWTDFVLPVTREEKIWEGGAEVIPGEPIEGLEAWLQKLAPARIFVLGQPGKTDWRKNCLEDDLWDVQEAFNRVRRIKDGAEIALIRSLAAMANQGYSRVRDFIKPGVSERQIQLEYEAAVLRAGAEKMPYDSIVGTGANSAILHAIPTSRIVKAGEFVLIDAGADVADYCVDITRIFPADGRFSTQQQSIYDLVLKAQEASIALCAPGTEWLDVHRASARVFAEGLLDLGILRGSPDALLEAGAVSVFFPHGVGHMVGLRVRDVGGKMTKDPRKAYGVRVRVDLPLEENFLMTVEPGLYFIEALLDDPDVRAKYQDMIDWTEVEKWRGFGGIRIEDDVRITKGLPDILTAVVPK
jgi:Xaa-Pro dipeptidase